MTAEHIVFNTGRTTNPFYEESEPSQCDECPHWHRCQNPMGEDFIFAMPWGDCDLMSQERNPLIEYDKPSDCPLEASE